MLVHSLWRPLQKEAVQKQTKNIPVYTSQREKLTTDSWKRTRRKAASELPHPEHLPVFCGKTIVHANRHNFEIIVYVLSAILILSF